MRMLTTLTSRISLGKVVVVIHPLVQLCYLRKCVTVSAVPVVLIIGICTSDNKFGKIILLDTMEINIKDLLKLVTYRVESDDVT